MTVTSVVFHYSFDDWFSWTSLFSQYDELTITICNTVRPQLSSNRFTKYMTSHKWQFKRLFLNYSFALRAFLQPQTAIFSSVSKTDTSLRRTVREVLNMLVFERVHCIAKYLLTCWYRPLAGTQCFPENKYVTRSPIRQYLHNTTCRMCDCHSDVCKCLHATQFLFTQFLMTNVGKRLFTRLNPINQDDNRIRQIACKAKVTKCIRSWENDAVFSWVDH